MRHPACSRPRRRLRTAPPLPRGGQDHPGHTPTIFRRTDAGCTGRSCRPTARCSAAPAACLKSASPSSTSTSRPRPRWNCGRSLGRRNWMGSSANAVPCSWGGTGVAPCGARHCAEGACLPAKRVPHRAARSGRSGVPDGGQRTLPAGPGADGDRQDGGHPVPPAARHARARHRQDRLPHVQGHGTVDGTGSAGRLACWHRRRGAARAGDGAQGPGGANTRTRPATAIRVHSPVASTTGCPARARKPWFRAGSTDRPSAVSP